MAITPISALLLFIYGFIAVTRSIVVSSNLMVTLGDAHWVELIWPHHWAGGTVCPPRREGKVRSGQSGTDEIIKDFVFKTVLFCSFTRFQYVKTGKNGIVFLFAFANVLKNFFITFITTVVWLVLCVCINSVLQNQELVNGRTGNVSFNSAGDRVNAVYEIVNIQSGASVVVGKCVVSNVSHFIRTRGY